MCFWLLGRFLSYLVCIKVYSVCFDKCKTDEIVENKNK